MIGYIVGSGYYEHPGFIHREVDTARGRVGVWLGQHGRNPVALISRHGEHHARLSHQVDHRANLLALKQVGATAVVSCSVCGVLRDDWKLGAPMLGTDLFFPSNRLPSGEPCSVFDTPGGRGRGHLIAGSLMDERLGAAIKAFWSDRGMAFHEGIYAHVDGPRFNTKVEIRQLRSVGADFLSQTCGPEAVLANELELPYALAAFGVDYANGVSKEPTPPEVLKGNLTKATEMFCHLVDALSEPERGWAFGNFVYRFDADGR